MTSATWTGPPAVCVTVRMMLFGPVGSGTSSPVPPVWPATWTVALRASPTRISRRTLPAPVAVIVTTSVPGPPRATDTPTVGRRASTVLVQVLFPSSLSVTTPFGSTAQAPPALGLAYRPNVDGVADSVTVNAPFVAPSVTVPPLAVQLRMLLTTEQLTLPATLVLAVTVGAP